MLNVRQRGFTLIELLVTVSIIAILSTVGVAAFVSYSRTQVLNAAASDLFTTLQIARSRAASQVKKSPECDNKVLEGYKVVLCGLDGLNPCVADNVIGNYEMDIICLGTATRILSKKLPPAVAFNTTFAESTESIFFYPLKGGVSGIGTITIGFTPSGLTPDKIITIYRDGRITIN